MDDRTETDDDLIRRAQALLADDVEPEEEFRRLYESHGAELLAACGRMPRPSHVGADDLVVEAMATFMARIDRYVTADREAEHSHRHLHAYLRQIASRLAIDYGRGSRGVATAMDPARLAESPATERDGDSYSPSGGMERAFAALSREERLVLTRSFEHYDPETRSVRLPPAVLQALCEELGRSPAAVKQLRHRARRKFEQAFRGEDPDTGAATSRAEP